MSACCIKVVALDIYGTVLAFDDCDYSCAPRKGLVDLFDRCDARGIKVVTSSDAFIGNMKNDLVMAFKFALEIIIDPDAKKEWKKD